MKRRGRKLSAWLAGVFVLVLVLLAALPYWLGVLLPSVLGRFHVSYGKYQTDGYSRLVLRDVVYSKDGTQFRAKEVHALTPIVWVFKRNTGFLNASDWTLSLEKTNAAPTSTNGFASAATKAKGQLQSVREWLVKMTLQNGSVQIGSQSYAVPTASWENGNVLATVTIPQLK